MQRMIPLIAVALSLVTVSSTIADDTEKAQQLINRAIKAVGGKKRL